MEEMPRKQYIPLVAFCLRHFLADFIICMCEFDFRQAQVPWQPVLDKRIGQHITGTVRDAGGIEWGFGRKRGLGI
jgi:hypothetical protein